MPCDDPSSLWSSLSAGCLAQCVLHGAEASVTLADLSHGSSLGGRLEELRGRSVLVVTRHQLTAALALIELDGIAGRLVLCPPNLPVEHLAFVVATAAVDALVTDQAAAAVEPLDVGRLVTCNPRITGAEPERSGRHRTEWVLLTSGTTGQPKLVAHTLSSLTAAIRDGGTPPRSSVWSTFYDIRRYGGLQIFLRALLGGGSLVLSSAEESTADFLDRAGTHGVTHISGTPSHWRRALMSPAARRISPRYVRLSGEIADQAILDHLRLVYSEARIAHAFASTEAGVAFAVDDGFAGFPASLLHRPGVEVQMKVGAGSLRIRSAGNAIRYLGCPAELLADADGFVDTGDLVDLRGDRYYFIGRRGGVINVGGLKVHPEEVEAVINRHPRVWISRVRSRKSPITGALVVADVVLKTAPEPAHGRVGLEHEILRLCREALAPHKVPTAIDFVPTLAVAASGKMARANA